jgi:hypothetical protein
MLLRIAKAVAALIAMAIVLLILVVQFGSTDTRLTCPGEVKRTEGETVTTPATLYARVVSYRWFMFWLDHDHMIFWEIQPGTDTRFGYFEDSSFGTNITELTGGKALGAFSSLSQRIYVLTSADGSEAFEGICKPT